MKIQLRVRCLLSGMMFLLLCQEAQAQTLAQHNWYFGNSTQGIRFDRGNNIPVLVTNQALPFGTGGSVTATDITNANVLFYSDGNVVYDGCNLPMPGTAGIGGLATANQPVAIAPVPGQTNRYFLFTNSANFTTGGTIRRLVINMNAPGSSIFPAPPSGAGEGTVGIVAGLTNRSEGMITVPHANGIDFWLITHQNNTGTFAATLINAAAYTSGIFSTTFTTSFASLPPTSVAHMSFHAASGKIAIAPQDTNTDAIILNFDDATGAFTFDQTIINSGVATIGNQSIYDVEWSRNGRFVYLSRHGDASNPANVFQFDTQNPTVTLAPLLAPAPFRSYGLQLAPDSAIYHLYQAITGGPFLMGRFTETDTIASEVIYEPVPLGNTNFNGRQFPSFLPQSNPTLTVSFTSLGTCQNSPTSFYPTVTPAADSLRWDFGDGQSSGSWSPIYTYQTASTFNVSLTAFFQGQPTSISQPVTINPFQLQLQLVQDTTACRSEFPAPRGSSSPAPFTVPLEITGGSATSIVWSNGDTGLNLTPDSAGYYYVVVTDASGCNGYAGVNVREYGLDDQRFNIWYFGDRAGIDFNVQPAVAIPAGTRTMNAPEGVSIVCDRNGDVIFYTDGNRVYDEDDTEIDNGIGGDPNSTQSALIVPVPDDETLYYIFTTQAVNGTSQYRLSYSLFDLKLNSGKGDIVQKNVTLFTRSTERITANDRWLIAHEYGNNVFRSYPITAQGIGDPVFTSIGADHSFKSIFNGEGYMKLGPRNNLAVALATPGTSNRIELFNLVDSTGRITNLRPINLNQPTGQVYGIEFSTGGSKLYATIKGPPSEVVEYFLDSLDRPFFRNRTPSASELGAIQRGPDGQIYFAINGSGILGTIAPNEDTTAVSVVNFTGFSLASATQSRLGLPNFIQNTGNAFGGPSLTFADGCLGTPTQFDVVPTDQIDTWDLFFGDGASVKDSTRAFHTYATAATFSVSLIMTNRCGLDTTLTRPITIFNPPPPPSLPAAIALCTGNLLLDANIPNTSNLTHLWTTLATTRTITVTEQGSYGVTNTDTNTGCTSTAQAIVVDNRPQVELGANETFCQNQSVVALPSNFPGLNVEWRITDPSNNTTIFPNYTGSTFPVDSSNPGSFIYTLTVTNSADPLNPCTNTDSKTYTFNVSPNFVLSAINPTGCGLSNGSVTLQINATTPASGPFSFSLTGPSGFSQLGLDRTAPSTAGPFGSRPAGTYSAVVTNQISNCTISQSIGLSDAPFSATAVSQAPNCQPVVVRVTTVGGTPNFTYRFTNNGTGIVTGPFAGSPAIFNSPGLLAGVYTVEVRDNSNCIFTFQHTVAPNTPVALTITSDLCTIPNPTLTATAAGASFVWTGPGIVGATNIATIQINQSGTYQVTATAAGQCPNTQNIAITVPPVLTPDFVQTDPCADNVILTATPTGNFTYRWLRNGVPTAFIGRQISLSVADAGSYQVEVRNTQTGCITLSSVKPVTIVGIINASLTAEQACNDDQPFTLTATSNATGVTFDWFLDNNLINAATTASIDQTNEGLYRVDITRATCTASAEILVSKAPVPIGALLDRVVICNDPDNRDPATATIELDPGASDSQSTFVAYNWFKNQVPAGSVARVFTADSEGIYEVDITNNFNCVSRDQTEVLNDCVPKITAPNAFRPTSKIADNVDFRVYSLFVTDEFQILIYNRWGELVFESKDRDFRWNGTYNNTGAALPGGTYAYIVKYVSRFRPEKGIQEQRGGVVLLR